MQADSCGRLHGEHLAITSLTGCTGSALNKRLARSYTRSYSAVEIYSAGQSPVENMLEETNL